LGLGGASLLTFLDKHVKIWKETALAYYRIVIVAFVWRYSHE
jgi:hypothetical protein